MRFKLNQSQSDPLDTLLIVIVLGLVAIVLIVGIIAFADGPSAHYRGESYYHNTDNNLYYVTVTNIENTDIKYEIETSSLIYAEQLSQMTDRTLSFYKDGYVSYNNERLPYRELK